MAKVYLVLKTQKISQKIKIIAMPLSANFQFPIMSDMFHNTIFSGFAMRLQFCQKNNILHMVFDGVISYYECNQVFAKLIEVSEQHNIRKWSFDLSNMYIHPKDLENILVDWFPRLHTQSQGRGFYTIVLPTDIENRKKFIDAFENGLCRKGCAMYFADTTEACQWLIGQGEGISSK